MPDVLEPLSDLDAAAALAQLVTVADALILVEKPYLNVFRCKRLDSVSVSLAIDGLSPEFIFVWLGCLLQVLIRVCNPIQLHDDSQLRQFERV